MTCFACDKTAHLSFDGLPICRWHLTWLWLACRLDWTD
jgi:hypothetical protein